MATLLLQVAGAALGSALGGPVGGIIGQAIGGIAGSQLDNAWLGGGSGNRHVEGPRLKEIGGLASSEGAPIPRLYGRARLGGQLIWATRFEEEVNVSVTRSKAGAKGGRSQKTYETTYSYYANLAVALCEGEIAFVRRIWADGRELDVSTVTMRVHRGSQTQEADPLIAAKEAGEAPAYRGLAYVVFERFLLAEYGNRVPQFAFEVVRAVPGLNEMVRAVTLIPGAGEFVCETRPVTHEPEAGVSESLTRHQLFGASDCETALQHLVALCPNLRRVALVVTWFGDDLRAGQCTVAPRVEVAHKPTMGAQWRVTGLSRGEARVVSQIEGRPAFGGTPSDESVVALIRTLRDDFGLEVVLYPFLMMDIAADNALPHPGTGEPGQPRYPWRGHITCAPAREAPGSADGTSAADEQVAAFLGTVTASDMIVAGGSVICAKPAEWSFRRLVLHYAALAKAAGGVDGFVIGSELPALTHIRGAAGYPMVDGLVSLASEARALLPHAKLTYAADWTEYGADVRDGGDEIGFPLDPLWASPAIDAIGIDYYPPLSDWRDAPAHADRAEAKGPVDLAYLRARLTAGEAFDWYYPDRAARDAQDRRPITDGAYGKPWIFRPKDLSGWWSNPHHPRSGGIETAATAFVPGLKPIWLTEIGIPAVDKGGNAPNVFPDPKSSDGVYPWFSSGARDDLVQARGLEAVLSGFDPARLGFEADRNPVHPDSGLRMVDPANIFVWSFDLRPFPAFPAVDLAWGDVSNFETGHWINGRIEGTPVDRLIAAMLADFGLPAADRIAVDGFLDGYVLDRPLSARQALEPLAQAFGFDAVMSSGALRFEGRAAPVTRNLTTDDLLLDREGRPFELRRAQESELPLELRLGFSDASEEYRGAAARSRRLAGAARREVGVETAIVTRRAEAQRLADQRLQEIWAGRETLDLELSPRCLELEPGDIVTLPVDGDQRLFRLTRISDAAGRRASARAVEPAIYQRGGVSDPRRPPRHPPAIVGRPLVVPLALPIIRGEPAPLLCVAGFASPWPGALAIWREEAGSFVPFAAIEACAIVGETLTDMPPGPLWRPDHAATVEVKLRGGHVGSVSPAAALAGANAFALVGGDGGIEIVTAARVDLVGERIYRLSGFTRGLGGSEAAAARSLPAGAGIVLLDAAVEPLVTGVDMLAQPRRYRIGPARAAVADPTMVEVEWAADAAALRPLAPVRVRARRQTDGVRFEWIRRTRIGGDSWDVAEVPLGEETELYRLRLFAGDDLVRDETSPQCSFLYHATNELGDFGAPQDVFSVTIAQVSAIAGPGMERRANVSVQL